MALVVPMRISNIVVLRENIKSMFSHKLNWYRGIIAGSHVGNFIKRLADFLFLRNTSKIELSSLIYSLYKHDVFLNGLHVF